MLIRDDIAPPVLQQNPLWYDYDLQCWVDDGKVKKCGHPRRTTLIHDFPCCTGCNHAGEDIVELRVKNGLPPVQQD